MKKSVQLLLLVYLALFFSPSIFSQLDTKHYIPPLFGREDTGTHYIVLSTPSTVPFDVTITDGAGNVITTQNISNLSSSSYLLGAGTATQFLVQESELNTVMSNEGLVLSGNYPFYVNIRVLAGPQAGSLTSKGSKAALGQDFRTGHLFNNSGDSFRKANVFGIMATEDNTTVNITGMATGVIFKNTPQTGGTSDDITVVLNQGETYVVAAYMDEPGATNNVNGVNGTHITSDKDVVVNTGTWLGGNAIVGGVPSNGRDLGIDQIVPLELVGDEYVVIKGEGVDNEKVIVVAAIDNTDLFLNGNVVPTTTINAGEYYVFDVNDFTANDNMYIESSNAVFVYQTENSGDGLTDDNERQCGLNFLPPIGCSGSKTVLLPDVDFIGTAQINIIANAGATVVVDGITLGAGDAVSGTASYVTYKLANAYTGDILITSDDLTRVSLVNLSGNVGAAGYFSGFTKDITVQTNTVNADNIALEGCIPASFTFGIDGPSIYDTEITYQVLGTATNGIDYAFIDTVLVIPAGQVAGSVFINSIADGFPEGQESVYIIYQPDPCSPVDTAVLFIDDAQPIEFTLDGTDLSCFDNNSGEILVNATGGFPPYTFHVTDNSGNGTTVQYMTNPITSLPADTYSVQVYDIYGCKADALLIGGIFDADTTFLPDGSGVSYDAILNISGFQAGQTLDNMSQLQQVCATMEHSYLGDLQIKIISPTGQEVILKQFNGGGSCDLGEPFASGPVDGSNSNLTDPGIGFEYCWNTTPNYGTMVAESNNFTHTIPASIGGTYTDNYLPAGAYTSFGNLDGLLGSELNGAWTLEVSDQFALDNGYIFNWNISLQSDLPDTLVTISEPNEIDVSGFITQAQCGTNDGAIDVSVLGDYPPFSFNWSSGQTTEDISGIGAGTYTVYVTDANGCVDSATYILNNISSLNITKTVTAITCSGGTNGAIDVTTSGGTPPYSFSWSSGQTTEDIAGVAAGTYTLTITDNIGCNFSENIIVTALPAINISLNSSTNEICSQDNGAININVSGGTGSYGYSWDNGATTQDLTNIGVGTYYVTVIDGNGCVANANYSIINDVSNCSGFCYTNIVVEQINEENCGDGTGSIDISVLDATMPYNISWSTGAIVDDISGLNAGTYTVTILDANQCELVQDITVGNSTGTLNSLGGSIINENCGNSDGAIDLNVSGGSLPYTFVWSNAATSEDISGLSAGTYDVTITDNAGCSVATSFAVSNNTGTLIASAVVSPETCGNGAGGVNITVAGGVAPYSYLWSNASTTQDIVSLSAGTYSVTITDDVGCTLMSPVYTVNNSPSDLTLLTVNMTNENCGDGAGAIDIQVINGTTPYTYLWSTAATTEDISGLSSGNYSCTITDNVGCEVTTGNLTLFNQGGSLDVSTNTVTDEVCSDGTGAIDINVTGGTAPYAFLWSTAAISEDVSTLSAGTYSVTVTDNNGCSLAYNEVVQNASAGFSLAITSVTNEVCGNGTGAVNITATGGTGSITYVWNNGGNTEDISALSAGAYSVVATDASGCVANASANVAGSGITINSSLVSDEICGNQAGAVNITFSGGLNPYNFSWSNGAITEDISGLAAGTYSVTITGIGGCTANQAFVVGNNTNGFAITSTVVTDENCGDGAGAIDVTKTGGVNPVSYLWNNGATTQDLFGLSAGNYSLLATDINGCSVNTNATVVNNSAGFMASINTVVDENCGDGTGSIDIDVTGGSAPYFYSWSSGQTTEDISGLSAGSYVLSVTDNNGCMVNVNATVLNNTGSFAISNQVIGNASCASPNGFIDLSITGGLTPYTYSWSNAATTQDIAGLSLGNYTCIITDNAGCTINYSGDVQSTGGNITTNVVLQNELCGNGQGEITVTVSGGINPYTFTWTGATPAACCDFTLDMQDAGNSWNGASIDVLINSVSIGTFTVPGGGANTEIFTACTGDNIELVWNSGAFDNEVSFDLLDPSMAVLYTHAQGTAPTPGSLFNTTASCPTGPPNQTSIDGLSAGTYSLTITDNVGCPVTEVYNVIDEPSDLQINISSINNSTCGNNNGSINYTVTGGSGNWTTTANGFTDGPPVGILSNLTPGDWDLITTDNVTGCTTAMTVAVGNDATFTATAVIIDETCGTDNGSIDVSVSGNIGAMDYTWSTGATTQDISGLGAGTYYLSMTDNGNGCDFDTSFTVDNQVDLVLTGAVSDENCMNGTGSIDLTITGSSDVAIGWSNGEMTEDISGLSSGTYTVSVINNLTGCLAEETFAVGNSSSGMTVSASITPEDCGNLDGAIDLTVVGGVGPFTYSWDSGQTTEDISGISWGTYNLTITDQNDGCTQVLSYVVTSTGSFNVDLIYSNNETCGDASGDINIDISGPGTFNPTILWSNAATTEDISGLSAGTYSVDVTNNTGCTMSMSVDILNESDLTVLSAISDETCGVSDGAIDLIVSTGSGTSFLWSTGATTEDITGLAAGPYDVTVTSGSGCSQFLSFNLSNNSTGVTILGALVQAELCDAADGSIDITVGGGVGPYSFVWDSGPMSEDLAGLLDGSYMVTVQDDNDGCQIQQTFVINDSVSDLAITNMLVTNEVCDAADGAIDVSITGGTGPFTYLWNNAANTEDIAGLTDGTYLLTVTDDATGCEVMQSADVLNVTSGIAISNVLVTNENCGQLDGAIDITVSGGVGPYSFLWSNAATTEDITDLGAGTYTITAIDDNDGCELVLDVVVVGSQNFTVTGVVQNASCVTCPTGSIDASVNEIVADGPYTYSWSSGQTTEDITALLPGPYTLTVTGASGCVYDTIFVVGNNNDVGIDPTLTDWQLNLYPNPSNTKVTLTYNFLNEQEVVFTMTNLLGEKVLISIISDGNGLFEFSVSEFGAGVYFIELRSLNESRVVKLTITE